MNSCGRIQECAKGTSEKTLTKTQMETYDFVQDLAQFQLSAITANSNAMEFKEFSDFDSGVDV